MTAREDTKTPLTDAPEVIYLQDGEESGGFHDGVTWCADKINSDDTRYVRADVAESRLASSEAEVEKLRNAGNRIAAYYEKSLDVGPLRHPSREALMWREFRAALTSSQTGQKQEEQP